MSLGSVALLSLMLSSTLDMSPALSSRDGKVFLVAAIEIWRNIRDINPLLPLCCGSLSLICEQADVLYLALPTWYIDESQAMALTPWPCRITFDLKHLRRSPIVLHRSRLRFRLPCRHYACFNAVHTYPEASSGRGTCASAFVAVVRILADPGTKASWVTSGRGRALSF